jgi:hypothetical protein
MPKQVSHVLRCQSGVEGMDGGAVAQAMGAETLGDAGGLGVLACFVSA